MAHRKHNGYGYKYKNRPKRKIAVNPTVPATVVKNISGSIAVTIYDAAFYRRESLNNTEQLQKLIPSLPSDRNMWIHVDFSEKETVEKICSLFNIHPLIVEDILSVGQRPKIDEFDTFLFTLVNMLFIHQDDFFVDVAQTSMILQKNVLLTFQDTAEIDFFGSLREKIGIPESRLRNLGVDYLYYSIMDMIVDNYFLIMEKLGDHIEDMEDRVSMDISTTTLTSINSLRKEMMFLRRSISPVREIINSVLRNESGIITPFTERYFKDIYDHIIQANELSENYRDMMINLQDLYLSNVNIRMNEVMKVMAIVTCLLAPATVIGGIFGMNFHRIPITNSPMGFYIAVFLMLFIPLVMIWIFKKRGWF